jgi:hypothetical protein
MRLKCMISINGGITGHILNGLSFQYPVGVRFIESLTFGLDQSSPYNPLYIEKIRIYKKETAYKGPRRRSKRG